MTPIATRSGLLDDLRRLLKGVSLPVDDLRRLLKEASLPVNAECRMPNAECRTPNAECRRCTPALARTTDSGASAIR
jgi:hypothetical protein